MARGMLPEDSRKSTFVLGVAIRSFVEVNLCGSGREDSPRELFHDAAQACSSQRYPGTNSCRLMQLRRPMLDFDFSFR